MTSMPRVLLLLLVSLSAYSQSRTYSTYGLVVPGFSATSYPLSAAASGGFSQSVLAFVFRPLVSSTVEALTVYASAGTGLSAGDLQCDIMSDSGNVPNVALTNGTSTTVTTLPTTGLQVEFTGFSAAVTAYTRYWIVLRNKNATPTTAFPTYRYFVTAVGAIVGGPVSAVKISSTGIANLVSAAAGSVPTYRVQYTGGAYDGQPYEAVLLSSAASANLRVYSAREAGAVFTSPVNASLVVKACAFYLQKISAPTGVLSCKIYAGNTLLATSDSSYQPSDVETTSRWSPFYFTTPVTLALNTTYRMVLSETNSDAATLYYIGGTMQYPSGAANTALLPANGTWRSTYCTAAGVSSCTGSWTDDATQIPIAALLLEPSGEFANTGGASAPVGVVRVQ